MDDQGNRRKVEGQRAQAGGKAYEEICKYLGLMSQKSYARNFKKRMSICVRAG